MPRKLSRTLTELFRWTQFRRLAEAMKRRGRIWYCIGVANELDQSHRNEFFEAVLLQFVRLGFTEAAKFIANSLERELRRDEVLMLIERSEKKTRFRDMLSAIALLPDDERTDELNRVLEKLLREGFVETAIDASNLIMDLRQGTNKRLSVLVNDVRVRVSQMQV